MKTTPETERIRTYSDPEAARQLVLQAFKSGRVSLEGKVSDVITEEEFQSIYGQTSGVVAEKIPGDASEASLADILALGKGPQEFPLGKKKVWVHRLTPAGITYVNRKVASEMKQLMHVKDEAQRAIETEIRVKLWQMVYCLRQTDDPESPQVVKEHEVKTLREAGVTGIVDQVNSIVESMEVDAAVLPEVALTFFGVNERLLIACDSLLRTGHLESASELLAVLTLSCARITRQGFLTRRMSEEIVESVTDLIEEAFQARGEEEIVEIE